MKRNMKRGWILLISACLLHIAATGQDRHLRVMTYNIMDGFNFGKDTGRQQKTAAWIYSQKPDIVALQELCDYSAERLQTEARGWGHPYTVLLKTKGYSVGLTSNMPITVKERKLEGMWHGMLHCQVGGIDIFVVHLSPDDYRIRGREADTIISRITGQQLENGRCIVLGDFNANSPLDDDMKKRVPLLLEKDIISDRKSLQYKNLADEYFDYSVISKFLSTPMIDVCRKYVASENRFSYSTPILIGRYRKNMEEVIQRRQRLDYILATPSMAHACTNAFIANGDATGYLSDHYPVIADFMLPN
ncbi:endonuclease/exonuclease/phosphatase family protein [Chitinophaga arvensicola]|uniref:Exonuclease III n=1 Tax=Chitinophaga arvensicola TaxID=29529 RepID=A0A1I0RTR7_9BACT|nr:endonuclease/exonuclease/phosphatase family protein [Chitinophaga arvensicola]SEW44711.1 Exonuclease III [Chitinophaga arvensicola]